MLLPWTDPGAATAGCKVVDLGESTHVFPNRYRPGSSNQSGERQIIQQVFWFFPKAAAKGSFKKSAVIKHCYQTLPKVLLKWWLSWKIVIKDCPAQSSAEVMAVFKDCHQRLPKVLLKWWLSLKIVIKDCLKFCWSDGCLQRLEKRLQIFD